MRTVCIVSGMNSAETALLHEANALRSNKVVMDFVTSEANEKTAADIRAKTGSGTTAKAVELLAHRRSDVRNRVNAYIAGGLVACLLLKYGQ